MKFLIILSLACIVTGTVVKKVPVRRTRSYLVRGCKSCADNYNSVYSAPSYSYAAPTYSYESAPTYSYASAPSYSYESAPSYSYSEPSYSAPSYSESSYTAPSYNSWGSSGYSSGYSNWGTSGTYAPSETVYTTVDKHPKGYPVYEYPESTQVNKQITTLYTTTVPVTYTYTYQQPLTQTSSSTIYHQAPALPVETPVAAPVEIPLQVPVSGQSWGHKRWDSIRKVWC